MEPPQHQLKIELAGKLGLDAAAAGLLAPLESERAALQDSTEDAVARMRAEAEDREQELSRLAAAQGWQQQLAEELGRCRHDLLHTAKSELDTLWHDFRARLLYQDTYLDNPAALLKRMVDEGSLIIGRVNELAARRAAQIQKDLAARTGVTLSHQAMPPVPEPPMPDMTATGSLDALDGQMMRRARETMFGMTMGSLLGWSAAAALGALFPPAAPFVVPAAMGIGGFAGAAAGFGTSAEATRKLDRDSRRRNLEREFRLLEQSQHSHLDHVLQSVTSEFGRAVTAELQSRLQAAKESAREEATRLRRASAATRTEATARLKAIERETAPLIRLRDQVARMTATATAKGQPSPAPAGGEPPRRGSDTPLAAASPDRATTGDSWADE